MARPRSDGEGRRQKQRKPRRPAGPADSKVVPARPLDAVDLAILRVLREDSRMSMAELAQRVSVSRANAYVRVERLVDEGVIQAFTIRVDRRRLGLGISALITMRVDQARWRDVRDGLSAMEEVEYYALTAGEFDMVVLVRAANIDAIRDAILERLHGIEGVQSTTTSLILDEIQSSVDILP